MKQVWVVRRTQPTANVTHPVKQGFIQTLGVFTDTLLICSCTAFIILLSDVHNALI